LILIALMGCGGGDEGEKTEGSPATGAGGAGALPTEVACGGIACKPITGPGLDAAPVPPCCADAFASQCGGMVGTSCMPLAEPHPVCPSVNSSNFGFTIVLIGCCVDDKCGVTGGFFGSECRDIETIRMGGMGMMGGAFLNNVLPQPQACTQ
jgi:hypothetical protein